jgi:hypothetical protein
MVRIVAALAAWAAGTAIATGITWLGADVVLRDAGVGPGMPVVNATILPSAQPAVTAQPAVSGRSPGPGPASSSVPASVSPGSAAGRPSSAAPSSAVPPPAVPPSAGARSAVPPSPAGSAHAYTLAGGRVTLAMTATSVQLVTAVPDAGYAVQTWSGPGWLRVDFSSGPRVSSLIASWYEHAPTITLEN